MELIDYNPLFGRWTYAGEDPHTGDTVIAEHFDKRHALATVDRTKLMEADKLGRGENMRLAFSLPPYLAEEMRQNKGIDARNRDHWPAVFAYVQSEYPHLIVNT